jgi:hypothetical protein
VKLKFTITSYVFKTDISKFRTGRNILEQFWLQKNFTYKEDSRNPTFSDSVTAKLHSLSEVRRSVASYDKLFYDNYSSIQVSI